MKESRAKEYTDHFEHIESNLKGLPEWPSNPAVRQADLEIIHSCIDESLNVARMILKDLGHELADDKQNMETLQEEFIELMDLFKEVVEDDLAD